uniref:Uncharacterized protein LOC114912734 n=1 Tax=Elaeis guineensis var. tenera TaxID=51953 RepID=A0A8N4ICD3_ELAGV|nr:uncharacterized protein LOC114912734 [Elaeis guineensis]
MPPRRTQNSLQACKLSATLLLFLPSLLFTLIFFSVFAFFLFLPIVCILSSIFLFSAFISRIPIMSLGRLVTKVCSSEDDWMVGEVPEFIEFDRSELPALDESSEEEERIKEVCEEDGEDIYEELRLLQADQIPLASGHCSSFYDILSFWRSKETRRV